MESSLVVNMSSNDWIQKGKEFLEESENAFNRDKYWITCFNAHQAAEFFLKGKLLAICGAFTFTHDLALLLKELSDCTPIELPQDILLAAQFVTPHYIGSRYPGSKGINYDKSLAQNCLMMSKKIIDWVKKI